MSIGLVLGGGAPNLTLMSGALAALHENHVEFDFISTLGAGMVVGLLYATAPKEGRIAALKTTVDLGVSDLIHSVFPANYKVFHKPGVAADWYRMFQRSLPLPKNDWTDLLFSTFCPTDLNPWSRGLCAPAPWIEQLVDFGKLGGFEGDFFLSAYCIDDRKMQMFKKEDINAEVFRAGLAMPFIYPPYRLGEKTYFEGSAYDTFNFEDLFIKYSKRPKLLIVPEVLGREEILRAPEHLLDAWVMSIITPLVSMARDDLKLFCLLHARKYRDTTRLLRLRYNIEDKYWPKVLDWSRANLSELYDVGYRSGLAFCRQYARELDRKEWLPDGVYPSCSEILGTDKPGVEFRSLAEASAEIDKPVTQRAA
jgi:NTE family protein